MFGMESDPFFGRKILVTGAARPFGRAVVLQLVGRGADVVAMDSDQAGLADLARETAGAIDLRRADAANPGDAADIAAWLRSAHVNLAGLIVGPGQAGAVMSADLAARLARLMRPNPHPFAALVMAAEPLAAPFRDQAIRPLMAALSPGWHPADCESLSATLLTAIARGRTSLALKPAYRRDAPRDFPARAEA